MIFLSKNARSKDLSSAWYMLPGAKRLTKKLTNVRIRRDSRRLIEEQLTDTSEEDRACDMERYYQALEEEVMHDTYAEMDRIEAERDIKFESVAHFRQWEAYQVWKDEWDF
jgi:hypothetical protein